MRGRPYLKFPNKWQQHKPRNATCVRAVVVPPPNAVAVVTVSLRAAATHVASLLVA